jgi:hypothetical protein
MSFPVVALNHDASIAVVANDHRGLHNGRPAGDDFQKIVRIPHGLANLTGHIGWRERVIAALQGEPGTWPAAIAKLAPDVRRWVKTVPREIQELAKESSRTYILAYTNPLTSWIADYYDGTVELGGRVTAGVPTGADAATVHAAVTKYDRELTAARNTQALVAATANLFAMMRTHLGADGSLSADTAIFVIEAPNE